MPGDDCIGYAVLGVVLAVFLNGWWGIPLIPALVVGGIAGFLLLQFGNWED